MKAPAENGLTDTKSANTLQEQVYLALEDLPKARGLARVFGSALFVLIAVNAVLVFVEPQVNLTMDVSQGLRVFGLVSSVCFGVEYAARLWVAPRVYPHKRPGRARLHYIVSPLGIIDLLAFLPGLLVFVVPVSASALNAARIIRLLRLIKLSRYMRGLRSIARVFEKRRHEIIAAFTVLALLTVTASVLMYEVENPVQPDKFDSVFTGMYWAMTTITSTGYGDLVPITAVGRLVGFLTMLLSIAVVAIPAGIFSAGFVSEFRSQDAHADKHFSKDDPDPDEANSEEASPDEANPDEANSDKDSW